MKAVALPGDNDRASISFTGHGLAPDHDETANQRRQRRFSSPSKIIRESVRIFRGFGPDRFDHSRNDDRKNVDGQITDPEAHYRRPITLN